MLYDQDCTGTNLFVAVQIQIVKVMRRERLEVNPVFSTAFAHAGPKGRQTTTGYIRLVNLCRQCIA